jgi:hypothetical protein
LLFDPLALKSSGLFKKVTDKKVDPDEESKDKVETETTKNKEEKSEIKSILSEEKENDFGFTSKKPVIKDVLKKDTIFDDEDLFQTKKSDKDTKNSKEKEIKVESKLEAKLEDDTFDDLFKPLPTSN